MMCCGFGGLLGRQDFRRKDRTDVRLLSWKAVLLKHRLVLLRHRLLEAAGRPFRNQMPKQWTPGSPAASRLSRQQWMGERAHYVLVEDGQWELYSSTSRARIWDSDLAPGPEAAIRCILDLPRRARH